MGNECCRRPGQACFYSQTPRQWGCDLPSLRGSPWAKGKLVSFPAQTARLSLPAVALRLGMFGDGPVAQGSIGELAAKSGRQLGPTVGGLVNATVVAGRAGLQ